MTVKNEEPMCKINTFKRPATMEDIKVADWQMYQYMVENGFTLQRGVQLHPGLATDALYVTGDFGDGNDWMNFDLFLAIYNRYYVGHSKR